VKNAFRFITVSLAIVALAACSQQTSAPTGTANDSLVLGMGEIPMGVGEGIEAQALDTVFDSVDPSDGAGIDFSVASPSDIVFDDVNNVNYIRTRVSVTNNTGAAITNLTLMAIAPKSGTVSSLSRLRDLVGSPLSQEEAFNANSVTDPTAVDPNFIPSPTHAVTINDEGGVEIIETRADFVAYEEDPTAGANRVGNNELTPIITELNTLAANTPAFGLTGVNGTDFSLLPYGFQVGSLADGATGFVDVTFSIPNDPTGVGVSPLARFGYTFVAVQDTEGRVTQAVEEIEIVNAPIDSGVGDVETRFLNPAAAQSNLQNVTSMALLGSAERDVTVPQTSVICIPDVRVTFGVTASIFDTTQNEAATAGDCVLNDASAFALAGDADGILDPQAAGQAIVDQSTPAEGYTLTLTDSGTAVEGRVIEAVITSAPTGVDPTFVSGTTSLTTDASGQVVFDDLVLNAVGMYTVEFRSGALLPVTETFNVGPGPFSEYTLVYTNALGVVDEDATFPAVFQSTDGITGDADPTATGIQDAFLAIRGVDEFGNEVDLSVDPTDVFIDVVLLQNGTPVAGNPVVGEDNGPDTDFDADADNNTVANPFPEEDDTVTPAVDPEPIVFPTNAANPGTHVFSGVNGTVAAIGTPDIQSPQLVVEQAGSNYQLQISIGETIGELSGSPIAVLTTPEFTVEPTVGSLNIVEDIADPSPAGAALTGVVSGQAIQVEVLDTTGAPMPNQTVAATVAACNGVASDTEVDNHLPIPAGDLDVGAGAVALPAGLAYGAATTTAGAYCTFASGSTRGGQFISAGGPDGNETGVRIIEATTNALGVATFSDANGNPLTLSETAGTGDAGVTAGEGYVVAFTAGYDADGLNGVTAFTNEFELRASLLASLLIDDDLDPTTSVPAEQPFEVDANGQLLDNATGATANIGVLALDKFGNILDVATPITISTVTPSSDAVYGLNLGGNLSNAGTDRTEFDAAANGNPGSGAGHNFAVGQYFVGVAGVGGGAVAPATVANAQPNAATTTAFRVRFAVVGTAVSVTSNTFDATP